MWYSEVRVLVYKLRTATELVHAATLFLFCDWKYADWKRDGALSARKAASNYHIHMDITTSPYTTYQ